MEKKKIIIVTFILAIAIIVGIEFLISYQKKSEMKEDTMAYLKDIGYDVEKDIHTVKVYKIWEQTRIGKIEFKGDYEVAIIFFDEPGVTYFYAYRGENEVQQRHAIPTNKALNDPLKHKESEQVQVLH
jgi:hypothetical protein